MKEFKTITKEVEVEDLERLLKPIFYTKIYWFLKRCLHKRILLLI